MGRRVHKVMGHGIKDLQFKEEDGGITMTDPRIDWDKLQERHRAACTTTLDKFLKWIGANDAALREIEEKERCSVLSWSRDPDLAQLKHNPNARRRPLANCVIHGTEYELSNVLLFIPPVELDMWTRHSDALDHAEETAVYNQVPRVVDLGPFGIFPYNANMVRFKDPEPGVWPVEQRLMNSVTGVTLDSRGRPIKLASNTYSQFTGHWNPDLDPLMTGQTLDHLKNDWRAQLPDNLLALLWWFKDCFPDFDAVRNSLRPLMYVYWA